MESILNLVPVLSVDLRAADIHVQVWVQPMADGETVGAHDLFIAVVALADGYAVLMDNVRDFHGVLGVEVRQLQW